MLRRTHCYIKTDTLNLVANQGDYDLLTLKPSWLAIDDIYLTSSGSNFRIRRMATTDLINLRLFQTSTSPVQMYALGGANMLMVYPTPAQTDTLTVYYVAKPTALANANDDPSSATL